MEEKAIAICYVTRNIGEGRQFLVVDRDNKLYLPAGDVELSETFQNGAIRLTKEQSGINTKHIEQLSGYDFFMAGNPRINVTKSGLVVLQYWNQGSTKEETRFAGVAKLEPKDPRKNPKNNFRYELLGNIANHRFLEKFDDMHQGILKLIEFVEDDYFQGYHDGWITGHNYNYERKASEAIAKIS